MYLLFLNLFKSTHTQHLHFLLGEETPIATAQVLLCQTGELHTVELNHTVAQMLEDAAHDTVLTAVNLNTHLTLIGVGSIFDSICMHLAISQFHTRSDLLDIMGGDVLIEEHVVHLLLQELGMREFAGQVAIVGEQQDTCSVAVETPYGIDTLGTNVLHQVHDGLTLLGIIAGGDTVLGFIEQHIHFLLQAHQLVMEMHLVGTHHLGAQFGHNLTVDFHHACLDEFVGLATTAHPRIGKELVQTDGFVGIDMLFLIFDAFLHVVLGRGIVARRMLAITIATTLLVAALLIATALLITTALLVTTLLVAATLLVTTLLTLLIATTLLVAAALLVATALLVTTLLTLLITTALLVAALTTFLTLFIAWTVALLLTRLITTLLIAIVVETWTVLTLCATFIFQTCTEAFRTEASFVDRSLIG